MLGLVDLTLTEPQTQALVTALSERLERLTLSFDLTMDIETLCQYDGQGRCRELWVWRDTRRIYRERLRRWGAEVGWAVTTDNNNWFIQRRGFIILYRENKSSAASSNVIGLINIMK